MIRCNFASYTPNKLPDGNNPSSAIGTRAVPPRAPATLVHSLPAAGNPALEQPTRKWHMPRRPAWAAHPTGGRRAGGPGACRGAPTIIKSLETLIFSSKERKTKLKTNSTQITGFFFFNHQYLLLVKIPGPGAISILYSSLQIICLDNLTYCIQISSTITAILRTPKYASHLKIIIQL